ncbi:hydrolase [Mesorhizobium sp. M0050]|uniref:hydrolase n=1 Tax=Mesorhizobium sp. M0050 TaxID=2956861 RepID=UPI003336246C
MGEHGLSVNWVYDCGTTSNDVLLENALEAFVRRQDLIETSTIRLCVLSHFDRDHVGGIVRLIERIPVTTLLLPYMPLWQRLVIALSEGVEADDPFFSFYLNPVAFLVSGGREGRIGEILFVPASGPEDSAPPDPPGFEGGPPRREIDLKVERGDQPEEASDDPAATSTTSVQVRFLRPAGRILAPSLWEFVPYNDASLSPNATPTFIAAANPLLSILLHDPANRRKALTNLKSLYDRHFGATSKNRNLISLFLYSGPLGRLRFEVGPPKASKAHSRSEDNRYAQIYTGDGTLDAGKRFDAFERFYGSGRLARTAFFQVMHHGSRHNWHQGIAAKLRPSVSLFSSDPLHRRFRHPHGEVLRDFWPYGAVQIDRDRGYQFDCWLSA